MTKIDVGPAPAHPGATLLVLVDDEWCVLVLVLVVVLVLALSVAVLDEVGPIPSSSPTSSPVRLPHATAPHEQTTSASAIRADRRMRQAR
jgi:hypothetical protein